MNPAPGGRYAEGLAPKTPEQAPPPIKTSVVVVSHNRAALLRKCLEALERAEERDTIQVLVVENGSTDGSAQMESEFPKVRFVRLPRNFGLTKALNIGVRASAGDYVLLLHDDTEVAADAVRLLAAALDASPEAYAVCPLLVTPSGAPAPQLSSLPAGGAWRPAETAPAAYAVEYAAGAALMLRAFFLKALRQIDERYGQFGSDAELAWQLNRSGKKTLLIAAARVLHHGRSGRDSPVRRADWAIGRAAYRGKYHGLAAGLMARAGAALSALAGLRLGELKHLLAGQRIDGSQR